ncbi:MAG: pyridoxal 5'-phosphate synthase [Gammaproteobacteria bacterium]|jgi:pyridoxamine 5'-phosphate oxidase
MIQFKNISSEEPYVIFQDWYQEAVNAGQLRVQAVAISSYNPDTELVDSRFVNLKYIDNDRWVFFSNYNGPKAQAFESNQSISALFYWSATDAQIRMRAHIKKIPAAESDAYFANREPEKNALAISSNQSNQIDSYERVIKKYQEALSSAERMTRPNYWGGFQFTPHYIEFWSGDRYRLNKRKVFEHIGTTWNSFFLEP